MNETNPPSNATSSPSASPSPATAEPPDGAAVRFPPPLVPLIALGVAVAMDGLVGSPGFPLAGLARGSVAVLLLATGLGLAGAAIGLFRGTGQDPKPWRSTPEIISTGVYRFTRNPMYLGVGLLQAGLGVALANTWAVLLGPVTWAVIQRIAIRHEEAYLERKFGAAYTDYRRAVRRWI